VSKDLLKFGVETQVIYLLMIKEMQLTLFVDRDKNKWACKTCPF